MNMLQIQWYWSITQAYDDHLANITCIFVTYNGNGECTKSYNQGEVKSSDYLIEKQGLTSMIKIFKSILVPL